MVEGHVTILQRGVCELCKMFSIWVPVLVLWVEMPTFSMNTFRNRSNCRILALDFSFVNAKPFRRAILMGGRVGD